MGPMDDRRLVLQRIARSIGEDARERAAFWHFAQLGLGDDEPENETVTKLALAEFIGDDVELRKDLQVRKIISACTKTWFVYFKASRKSQNQLEWWPERKKLPTISEILELIPSHVQMEIDTRGIWNLKARDRIGRIITDGVDQAIAGLPIRHCAFCSEIFAPARRDSKYCRAACRSSHATARHRAAKNKETKE